MSYDAGNPYQATGESGAPPYRRGTMEYGRMVSYVFENPRWFVNLLLMAVCQLIPIVGPLAIMGYHFEIVETLHRDPRRRYPDFDFARLVDYLVRGLWPFLVVLVASLVLMPIILGCAAALGVGVFIAVSGAGNQNIAPAFFAMLPFIVLGFMVLSLVLQLLLTPLQIRAGLAQDFAAAFDFVFFKRFLASIWKECVVGMLFLMVAGLGALILGLALCFFGILLTMSVMMLAQAHFHFQLYELYLDRGGEGVPLKAPGPQRPAPMPRPMP
jgi:hypothetical protein